MLAISSNRTLSPRPIPTDPLLNYHFQDAAAAAVGPWLYSSISSVSPPFSSAYSFGAEDLSPQASSSPTSSSSPPAICPGLSSSSSYSITSHLPVAEFGGVMHPNSDEDSSADEDAFCAEPVQPQQQDQQQSQQQQQQQQQQLPHQHPHHLSHPTASSSLKRSSPRQLYELHPAPAGVSSSYSPFPRGLQDSGPSDFGHGSPQSAYVDHPRKLADPSTQSQTHADAHPEQYHHLLPSIPPTAPAPHSIPTPASVHPTSTGGFDKSYGSPTLSAHEAYKAFPALSGPSNLIEHKPGQTPSTHELDPHILHMVRTRIEVKNWEEEGSLYFQIEFNGQCVGRVEKNNLVNGTKLLNITGISRGKRDGILKNEKTRKVIKHGTMHLKGVWIAFDRAIALAEQYGIMDKVYPLLMPNLHRYIHVLSLPPPSSKLAPDSVVHHAPKFNNAGLPFINRQQTSQYAPDQQPAWTSSSHAIAYHEPYSAPPQSGAEGSPYEQAQYSYLNSNLAGSDLSERRHTVPNYNSFQGLPSFNASTLAYASSYGSSQFSPYSSSSRPPPTSNSPSQFAYSLASHPSPASGGSTYNYPGVNANPSSVYNLAPGPPTSSSGTTQSSSPALHSAPVPGSPPLRSPNPLEPGTSANYARGQVGSLKRDAEDELSRSSGSTHGAYQRRVQARILSDPSPHSFRQTVTTGPGRYPDWTGSSAVATHQLSIGGEQAESPSHSNPSLAPPAQSGSVTNCGNSSGRAGTEESRSGLIAHPLVNIPLAPPETSSGSNSTSYGSGGAPSRPAPNNPNRI
ncbi:hypothetical protein CROQUDRAFT_129698 [Cronartium quercuum f. sp. fusiforme G11]|uniref:HTH APSES-type domain-containing protein n=1 Tax=Cronartium quercuum f. sp. fusiforme G11 TaxID=708437 RepID=A0A9P6TGV8_9BASI|nr:hypothetical protein CROQUDRAFT_129698 [Cronartium quercuum f. sp. fusiforme G11]